MGQIGCMVRERAVVHKAIPLLLSRGFTGAINAVWGATNATCFHANGCKSADHSCIPFQSMSQSTDLDWGKESVSVLFPLINLAWSLKPLLAQPPPPTTTIALRIDGPDA